MYFDIICEGEYGEIEAVKEKQRMEKRMIARMHHDQLLSRDRMIVFAILNYQKRGAFLTHALPLNKQHKHYFQIPKLIVVFS